MSPSALFFDSLCSTFCAPFVFVSYSVATLFVAFACTGQLFHAAQQVFFSFWRGLPCAWRGELF